MEAGDTFKKNISIPYRKSILISIWTSPLTSKCWCHLQLTFNFKFCHRIVCYQGNSMLILATLFTLSSVCVYCWSVFQGQKLMKISVLHIWPPYWPWQWPWIANVILLLNKQIQSNWADLKYVSSFMARVWFVGTFRPRRNHKNHDFGPFHLNFDCKHVVNQPESLSYSTGTTHKWGWVLLGQNLD